MGISQVWLSFNIARYNQLSCDLSHYQELQIAEVFVGGTFWTQTMTAAATLDKITLQDDGRGLYVVAKSNESTTSYDSPPAKVAILGISYCILVLWYQLSPQF